MTGNLRYLKNIAISFALTGEMIGFASVAQAPDYSHHMVRDAQLQLMNDGYYTGTIDGVDGPLTHAAIRQYQQDNNLAVNGHLDRQTRDSLLQNVNEANREVNEANREVPENYAVVSSPATIRATQRQLKAEGFYKGAVDGQMGAETQSSIREFQRNSNLSVTGQLDQGTLSRLGVSR